MPKVVKGQRSFHSDDSSGHSSPSSPSDVSPSSYNPITFPAPDDEPESPTSSKHHRPSLLKTVIKRNSMMGLRTFSYKTEEDSDEATSPTSTKGKGGKEHGHGIHLPSIHLPHPHLHFSSHNHSSHSSQSSDESLEAVPVEHAPLPPLAHTDIFPTPKRRISLPSFHFRRHSSKHEEPMKTLSYMVPFSFAASAVGRGVSAAGPDAALPEGSIHSPNDVDDVARSPSSSMDTDLHVEYVGPPGLPAVTEVSVPIAEKPAPPTLSPIQIPQTPIPVTTLPPIQIATPKPAVLAGPTPPSDIPDIPDVPSPVISLPPAPAPNPLSHPTHSTESLSPPIGLSHPLSSSHSLSPSSNRKQFWASWQRTLGISHMSRSRLAFRALVLLMEIAYLRVGRWRDARKIGIVLMLELVDYGVAGVDQKRGRGGGRGGEEDVFERMSGDGEYGDVD